MAVELDVTPGVLRSRPSRRGGTPLRVRRGGVVPGPPLRVRRGGVVGSFGAHALWRNQRPASEPARRRPPRCGRRRAPARSSGGEAASASTSGPRPATPRAPRPLPPTRRRSAPRRIPLDPHRPRPVDDRRWLTGSSLSGYGVRSERRSGTRDSESTSSTRSTASFPATARAWRTASASRLRLLAVRGFGERRLVARGRPRLERLQAQRGGGAGKLLELREQRQAQARRVGAGAAQRRHGPPASAPGQPRAEPQAPQASSAARRVGEQAIDEQ